MKGNGNLVIKPKRGKIEKEVSLIEKLDSYLQIYIDLKKKTKSEILKNGGKRPKFKNYYSLRVSPEDKLLNIDLYDQDLVTKDDFIGNINLQLNEIKELRYINNVFVIRNREGKKTGSLELEIEYYDDFDTSTEEDEEEIREENDFREKEEVLDNVLDFRFRKGDWKMNRSSRTGVRVKRGIIGGYDEGRKQFGEDLGKGRSGKTSYDVSSDFIPKQDMGYNPLNVNITKKLSLIKQKNSIDGKIN